MEARIARVVSAGMRLVGCCFITASSAAHAAGYKTANFTVAAPTPQLAQEIGNQAEHYRHDLAIEWLGQELPQWSKPCPIHAQVAPNLGAGGATSFVFDRGEVYNWKMNIQGSRERILDSVLPHEVTHTIFASYFRQPLPRWADEGACTTVEHRSEIAKQEANLVRFLRTGRGIPFREMFAMKEYPADVMPLYAQGHALAEWLIQYRGRKAFLEFLADGMRDDNWPRAVQAHYGFSSLLAMQESWNGWVRQGRPTLAPASDPTGQLATNARNTTGGVATPAGVRLQSPDSVAPAGPTAPTTPIAMDIPTRAMPTTAVTVASANQSVYAAAAQLAERDGAVPTHPVTPMLTGEASVYDASRPKTLLRR